MPLKNLKFGQSLKKTEEQESRITDPLDPLESFEINPKFQENRLRTTLKSQVKNKFSFPCIPIFDNL